MGDEQVALQMFVQKFEKVLEIIPKHQKMIYFTTRLTHTDGASNYIPHLLDDRVFQHVSNYLTLQERVSNFYESGPQLVIELHTYE